MFNKYKRDLTVKRVAELQKQRIRSGYIIEEKFHETPANIQRIMASPRRNFTQEYQNASLHSTSQKPSSDPNIADNGGVLSGLT